MAKVNLSEWVKARSSQKEIAGGISYGVCNSMQSKLPATETGEDLPVGA